MIQELLATQVNLQSQKNVYYNRLHLLLSFFFFLFIFIFDIFLFVFIKSYFMLKEGYTLIMLLRNIHLSLISEYVKMSESEYGERPERGREV